MTAPKANKRPRSETNGHNDRLYKRPKPEENGSLGIDIGSTYTRIAIYCPSTDPNENPERGTFNVPHPGGFRVGASNLKTGEWSSTGFPYDSGRAYTGSLFDEGRCGTSLKPGFVIASDLPDSEKMMQIQDYPHAGFIQAKLLQNPSHCSRKYREGLCLLLAELATSVSAYCQARNIRIVSIGVGMPGQWPCEVQSAYHEMVYKEFRHATPAVRTSDIYFLSETQAMMHYMFHLRLKVLQEWHNPNSRVIVLDFGGQNINISVYAVVYSETEGKAPTLYEICPPEGIVGGSEKHAELIGHHCEKICQSQGNPDESSTRLQEFIEDFNAKKQAYDERHDTPLRKYKRFDGGECCVEVTRAVIEETFEEAFRKPLEKVEAILTEFCPEPRRKQGRVAPRHQVGLKQGASPRRRQGPKPCVIIAGGSSRYRPLRARLQELCANLELQEPIFDQDLKGFANFESHSVAQGAALATARSVMNIEDFIQRGAAWGIQERAVDDNEDDRAWENSAAVHYRGDLCTDIHSQVFRFQGGEEVKIICNPFHSTGLAKAPERIKATDAYDFYFLGQANAGDADFTIDISHDGPEDFTLHVSMEWWPPGCRDHDAPYTGTLSLPLRWDRGSNSVLVTDHEAGIKRGFPAQAFTQLSEEDAKKIPPGRGLKLARRGGRRSAPGRGGGLSRAV